MPNRLCSRSWITGPLTAGLHYEGAKDEDAPALKKLVLPGIELRLAAPMKGRLNAHVLFSNEVDEQVLRDFISALRIELVDRPLSEPALRELARKVGEDKLKHHGFKKADVDASEEKALLAGVVIAEINADSYRDAIRKVPNEHAIGLMPFDTNDGLAEVGWQEHYAYAMNLFRPLRSSRHAMPTCAAHLLASRQPATPSGSRTLKRV